MGKPVVKGGIWKNTEDEILKAAVMKYGKNQWSRIASLLHRKTAKQCKLRWYEWLDPSIKKIEWSREEEEKLLHLAKLMPTQWRTIAPIIGRTPAQCLEHYEKLLDQAQGGESEDDPRRLRPGEIDPNPHTKPPKPDPIDMDEDEKEMLSEARARLANTQGKKAKRKARERVLEEARRLADLQKKRELRAAGITVFEWKRRRRGVDYNKEIPFEKRPAVGFFDASQDEEPMKEGAFKPVTIAQLEGESRRVVEERERKKDKARLEKLKETDMPRAVLQLNQMSDIDLKRRRSKLVLPAPQVNEKELETLVKMGKSSLDQDSSDPLLQDYGATPSVSSLRTPRQQQTTDTLLSEAQNIIAYNRTQNVLEGGENTPLRDNGGHFGGMTPQHQVVATPNPLLSTPALHITGNTPVARTPGRQLPVAPTPVRDMLGINSDTSFGATPSNEHEMRQHQEQLKRAFKTLPKPKGGYEVVVPEAEEEEAQPMSDFVEDAADRDLRTQAELTALEELFFKRQSQVVQRKLPMPGNINKGVLLDSEPRNEEQAIDEMIKREMMSMLEADKGLFEGERETFEDTEMASARKMLNNEIDDVEHNMGLDLSVKEYMAMWTAQRDDVVYLPSKQRYARATLASAKDRLEALEHSHKTLRDFSVADAKRAAKMEKKLALLTGGYQKRSSMIKTYIGDLYSQYQKLSRDLISFERLKKNESEAITRRVSSLESEVEVQVTRERSLQQKYKTLVAERDALLASVSGDLPQGETA